jgi:hypothetical protein
MYELSQLGLIYGRYNTGRRKAITMESVLIYFQFIHQKAALQAFDTLQELNYDVKWLNHEHKEHLPTLSLNLNHCDLTSALEITQAHGGVLVEGKQASQELDVITSAYNLDEIAIPAHVVNDEEFMDPSDGDYDHFPAGVRL